MLTYTTSRNLYGDLTNNDSTTNLTLGDVLINEGTREMLGSYDWNFLEKIATVNTVASQQTYELPADYSKLINVTVTIGTTVWTMNEITSQEDWNLLNQTSFTSDIPQYYFIFNRQIKLYPTPSSSSNVITIQYKRSVKDLSLADYTTGSIVSIASGASAVVGSGTSWTNQMVGRYLRIDKANTANTGDDEWYEIKTIGSTTSITLLRTYQGNSITAGSATYTIGDISIIPQDYHMGPVWFAVAEYWEKEGEVGKSDRYRDRYERLKKQMRADLGSKSTSVGIRQTKDIKPVNPNLYITA